MLKCAALALVAITISTAAHADLSISNKPTKNMSCSAGGRLPSGAK